MLLLLVLLVLRRGTLARLAGGPSAPTRAAPRDEAAWLRAVGAREVGLLVLLVLLVLQQPL